MEFPVGGTTLPRHPPAGKETNRQYHEKQQEVQKYEWVFRGAYKDLDSAIPHQFCEPRPLRKNPLDGHPGTPTLLSVFCSTPPGDRVWLVGMMSGKVHNVVTLPYRSVHAAREGNTGTPPL
ncbi:hypothetical protein Pmani_036333 [Petrolisthes manimaculis]|uniref:Uncharacterized protein n=1 Tax=Petrolisthes manimaculis TaxID=1843537 RepID=A0AAE1NKE1_9EUCA|nr:hypothetical protein Pmani_036333 [Petrolisthes manimaculis]